jgi:hypothetical protein
VTSIIPLAAGLAFLHAWQGAVSGQTADSLGIKPDRRLQDAIQTACDTYFDIKCTAAKKLQQIGTLWDLTQDEEPLLGQLLHFYCRHGAPGDRQEQARLFVLRVIAQLDHLEPEVDG